MPQHRAQPEALLQRTLFQHIRLRQQPGWVIWATPNAGKRSPRYGAELKRQGLTAGVGDINLVGPDGLYHELELKTEKGKLSPAQRERLFALEAAGAIVDVAFGLDDALARLKAWGAIR